jgi:hypothetical protein
VLLDAAVADAIAGHRVAAPDEVDRAAVVARFPASSGEVRVLARGAATGTPATLDDIVIGYLALARSGHEMTSRVA